MIASAVLIGVLAVGALGVPPVDLLDEKIIGGTSAKLGEIPYIISLKKNGNHTCGGSILDATHILTAAHCIAKSSAGPLQIQYGVIDAHSKENRIQVKKIHIHEHYNPNQVYINDVAVLTLEEEIQFSENTKPTVLPEQNLNFTGNSIKSRVSGWGFTENSEDQRFLLTTEIPLFDDATCREKLGDSYHSEYHVCAGDLDGSHKPCNDDSGDPLYAEGIQYGLVSYLYKPCTIKEKPGIFTRLANYVDWINAAMID